MVDQKLLHRDTINNCFYILNVYVKFKYVFKI